jgi:hypothetical protein
VLPLIKTFDTLVSDGSEPLSKNHSKLGEITFVGSGLGLISIEQFNVKFSPGVTVTESMGEIVTFPRFTKLNIIIMN